MVRVDLRHIGCHGLDLPFEVALIHVKVLLTCLLMLSEQVIQPVFKGVYLLLNQLIDLFLELLLKVNTVLIVLTLSYDFTLRFMLILIDLLKLAVQARITWNNIVWIIRVRDRNLVEFLLWLWVHFWHCNFLFALSRCVIVSNLLGFWRVDRRPNLELYLSLVSLFNFGASIGHLNGPWATSASRFTQSTVTLSL